MVGGELRKEFGKEWKGEEVERRDSGEDWKMLGLVDMFEGGDWVILMEVWVLGVRIERKG